MPTLPQLIDDYLAGPAALRRAVSGMTREQVLARPVQGKWSTLEVVAHIADFDPILADRVKRIIALDSPPLTGADENRFAAALAYQDRDLEEELTIIERTRTQLARILRKQTDDVLQRVGIHSERGPLTLERMLTMAARHIPHHVQFIEEKRQALGLQPAGSAAS
jgi:DinB superfamily